MVYLYHVIFGTYGFWLPNDPRGSWSEWIGSWDLFRYGGPATKVDDRRSHAWDEHDVAQRLAAKEALKYPPVVFTGRQALAVAHGFARVVTKSGYVIYACAILPQHTHLVVGRHHYSIEQVVRRLKQAASIALAEEGVHPLQNYSEKDGSIPTPWARRCWKCFIDNEPYAHAAIKYVFRDPTKEGKSPQQWSFLTPFTGLPTSF